VSGSGGGIRVTRIDRSAASTSDALRTSLAAVLGSADLVLVDAGAAVEDAAAFAFLSEVGAVVTVVRSKDRSGAPGELRHRLELAGRDADGVLVTHRSWLPAMGGSSSSGDQPARPAAAQAPAPSRPAAPETAPQTAAPALSANGQPGNGQPTNGQYANGQPANGQAVTGASANGRSTGATKVDGSAPADSSEATR
jgi:hypothetical protein